MYDFNGGTENWRVEELDPSILKIPEDKLVSIDAARSVVPVTQDESRFAHVAMMYCFNDEHAIFSYLELHKLVVLRSRREKYGMDNGKKLSRASSSNSKQVEEVAAKHGCCFLLLVGSNDLIEVKHDLIIASSRTREEAIKEYAVFG